MEFNHTKGEWKVQESDSKYYVNAHCNICEIDKGKWANYQVPAESLANAKLIAAAPELLEALIRCEKQLELAQARLSMNSSDDNKAQCIANVRGEALEAIKKATE